MSVRNNNEQGEVAMIQKEIEGAINGQINQEFGASYAYLGMAAYFETNNLTGFAHWCVVQQEEENQHAMRLFRYLLDRGGNISLEKIKKPRQDYKNPQEVFEVALSHEQANTKSINHLYELASTFNDHATMSHLQWFLNEQVEEEKMVGELVSLIKMAGSDVNALLYLNDKLGSRTAEDV